MNKPIDFLRDFWVDFDREVVRSISCSDFGFVFSVFPVIMVNTPWKRKGKGAASSSSQKRAKIGDSKDSSKRKRKNLESHAGEEDLRAPPPIRNSLKLMHEVLFHVVHQTNPDELWFKFGESFVKFSIEEFALNTGLKCVGDCNLVSYLDSSTSTLVEKYFEGYSKGLVRRDAIKNCFKTYPFESDEEAVKMGLLYFISSFLLAKERMFVLVWTILQFWIVLGLLIFLGEKVAFGMLLDSFKCCLEILYKREDKVVVRTTRDKVAYKIGGLAFVFQVWIYECIPRVAGFCALRKSIDEPIPRIFKWQTNDKGYSNMPSNVFKNDNGKKALKSAKDLPSSSVPNLEDDDDVDSVVSEISSLRSDVTQKFSDMSAHFYLLAESVKCLGKKSDSMFPSRKKFIYVVSDDGIKIDDEEKEGNEEDEEGDEEEEDEEGAEDDDYDGESKKKVVVKENAIEGEKKGLEKINTDGGEDCEKDQGKNNVASDVSDKKIEETITSVVKDFGGMESNDAILIALVDDDDDFLNFCAFSPDIDSEPLKEDVERHKMWGPAKAAHVINPGIDFKVAIIGSKYWFYDLFKPKHWLSSSIMFWDTMFCSVPFCDVDFLLVPIFVEYNNHWILAYIDFKFHGLTIYNLLRSKKTKSEVLNSVKPMATILHFLLNSVGFLDNHEEKYFCSQWSLLEAFGIMVADCPQQENDGDCGVYILKYAECLMQTTPMDKYFKRENPSCFFRWKMAVGLFNHGKRKQDLQCQSDDNRGEKLPMMHFMEKDMDVLSVEDD
ncbi:Sentrin-specific protease 1 [Morus notabilis]|uniref:Sentrin-specific protease 1 n=1 Tax=Morus notabilis TaxID=981085 RepID=W9RLZ4_9ROSA|nr:Sentrin-specific protease 1 [Morus notabilis]